MTNPHPYPLWHPVYWLATWFHVGLIPKAPGTFGTLAALPFAGWLYHALGWTGFAVITLLCTLLGWWVSARYANTTGREDPKEVVIDEVAGMWLTLLLVIALMPFEKGQLIGVLGTTIWMTLPSFLAFRLFDITKPWPISWCDRHIKGGLGIMLDDLLAACFAVPLVLLIQYAAIYYIGANYGA